MALAAVAPVEEAGIASEESVQEPGYPQGLARPKEQVGVVREGKSATVPGVRVRRRFTTRTILCTGSSSS
jgi:hypothetical protein